MTMSGETSGWNNLLWMEGKVGTEHATVFYQQVKTFFVLSAIPSMTPPSCLMYCCPAILQMYFNFGFNLMHLDNVLLLLASWEALIE